MAVVWLAVAYFVSGKLGLLLAVPPGYATAVFPASGIALGGMLVLGYRAWPGVLLGSFVMNLSISFDASSAGALANSVLLPFGIASGATLQAVFSTYLVRRFVAFPIAFNRGGQVVSLLFWGGPFGCVVNAIISISILVAAGRIPLENFPFNSATWWIGDTFGVLVFTPLILVWARSSERSRFAGNLAITVPGVCAFVGAVIVVWYASSWERTRLSQNFSDQAEFLSSALAKTLSEYRGALNSLRSFMIAADRVERSHFRDFTRGLLDNDPHIQALSWNRRVRHEERRAFEAEGENFGFADFRITERNNEGQLVPAGDRPEYVAVYFIEPYESNRAASGFDVASDTTRRAALFRVRDTGEPATTGRIKLVQESAQQYGVLTFQAIYEEDFRNAGVEARRRALKGYVVGVLRLGDLVEETFKDLDTNDLVFRLLDGSAEPEEQLLYASRLQETGITVLEERSLFGGVSDLLHTRSYDFGGRRWLLHIAPTQRYVARHRPENAWLILLGGLAMSSLIVAFSVVFMGRDEELERLVEARTAELRAAQEKLLRQTRLATLGQIAGTVSHELRNPLGSIRSASDVIKKIAGGEDARMTRAIALLERAQGRCDRVIEELLDYTRVRDLDLRPTRVDDWLGTLLDEYDLPPTVTLQRKLNSGIEAALDRDRLGRSVRNVIDNACHAMYGKEGDDAEAGVRTLTVVTRVADGRLELSVEDTGPGIPPGDEAKVFEPLFSTKSFGVSLGLPMVKQIMEQHGGGVEINSMAGCGTEVVLWLPLPEPARQIAS